LRPSLTDPRVEFRGVVEAEISKALNDPEATNPIVAEVARLIAGYSANLSLHVVGEPRWPIEAVEAASKHQARAQTPSSPPKSPRRQKATRRLVAVCINRKLRN
jgi:hypothetical protein